MKTEKHRTEMVNGLRASHSHILSRDNDEDDKRNDLKPNFFLSCIQFYFMNLFLVFTFYIYVSHSTQDKYIQFSAMEYHR